MLAGDHPPLPPLPESTDRYSFHGEYSSSSIHNTRANARKILARQSVSSGGSSNLIHSSYSQPMQQQTPLHSQRRSISTGSTPASLLAPAVVKVTAPESSVPAKEKEFMANARIAAMSNLIDSFALSSHAKHGFYGKQLKVTGSVSSPPSSTGAELDLAIKIHVIENTWTTCPLLPPSTILHRWKVTLLDSPNHHIDGEDDIISDHGHTKEGKRSSWVQTTVERTETISPAPSPTYEQRSARPLSTSSFSSYSAGQNVAQQTHVAVISNALCFVANKSGDYLVQLSIHVPFVAGADSQIFLAQIPKCRNNFIRFRVEPPEPKKDEDGKEDLGGVDGTKNYGEHEDILGCTSDGFEFNIHPEIKSLDDSHLSPDSDEDALFWLEVQELLVGRDKLVGKLAASDDAPKSNAETQQDSAQEPLSNGVSNRFEIAGCFTPSSSLLVSWMPRNATNFVQDVEQEMTIHIAGLPDQTKSSTLLQHRKRKDPEVSHAIDQIDQEEGLIEYDHLEMDDGDLVISVEDVLTVNIQKLGWKQPFMDITIDLSDTQHRQTNDMSLLEITGDAVQDYEAIFTDNADQTSTEQTPSELENLDKESTVDHERHLPAVYRVWFFNGTEGTTVVHVRVRVGQAVSVGYGKDISCNIPRIQVHGASLDKGRIHIHTSNDLVIQRCNTRYLESPPIDGHSLLDDNSSARHPPMLRFQYQSSDYQLMVIAQRYQGIARIARIERIKAEIGVSGQHHPGFARVLLTNVVLPYQDDSYLRVYQLDGAEIWNVMVDGKPCTKSIQFTERKSGSQRTIMIPISEDVSDSDNLHQVEISYGFNTVDRDQGEDLDDETVNPMIKLVVPGFNLPVGEYVVVASLPKLPKDMDYDEPVGDFEITSKLGELNQRKTITFGAYMTLGRPKLSVKASRTAFAPRSWQSVTGGTMAEAVESSDQPEILEQITRTHAHPNLIAHDPQQPPSNAGPVVVQQASQRHPQQPLDLQNPQAEQALDGEILPVLGVRPRRTEGSSVQASGQTSNLSPQVGLDSLSPRHWLEQICHAGFWWKQLLVILAASLLVIMIVNATNFRDTMSTSLDLVHVPVWQRPFAAIGRLWHDNSHHRQGGQYSEPDRANNEYFVRDEPVAETLQPKNTETLQPRVTETLQTRITETESVASAVTTAAETTQDLEVRPRVASNDDRSRSDDGKNDDTRPQPVGFMKLIQMLKRMVGGAEA